MTACRSLFPLTDDLTAGHAQGPDSHFSYKPDVKTYAEPNDRGKIK